MEHLPRNRGENTARSRIKWIVYIVAIFLTALFQSLPAFPTISSVRPVLMVPVVICISMFEGPIGGAVAGIVGGFFWDMFDFRIFGFNALILLVICCLCGLISQLYIRNNIISCVVMIISALLIHSLFDCFFNYILLSEPDVPYILKNVFIPRIIYTIIVSPIIYAFLFLIAKLFRKKEA